METLFTHALFEDITLITRNRRVDALATKLEKGYTRVIKYLEQQRGIIK